ncbi:MAG: DNA translocase FtsK 4TM domain-containing protein, partial [Deltaproteobacteria bacterium]|nr:DNA translocase FtsK 4TM domain-containing protein [Deltaproteobacteria bacterium]
MPTVPPELPALAALFLAVLILLSLVSHVPGEEQAASGAVGLKNHLGYLGAHFSAFLVKLFGMASFWPVPALMLYPFYRLTSRGKDVPVFAAAAGIVLSAFSVVSFASVLFPGSMPFPWPKEASGGGAMGDFLARGITLLAGRVGSLLVLPALLASGLMLSTGVTPGSLRWLFRTGGASAGSGGEGGEGREGREGARAVELVVRGRGGKPGADGFEPGGAGRG